MSSSFQKMQTKRELESIFLFVTGRCNAKCAMCFYANEMDKREKELTFDEIKKISETAGDFSRLWLSGGEPTLREDLPEILEMFYKNNHIKDVNMPTNGLRPDRVVEWVKRFRKNCPDCNFIVSVSLDGFGDTHDKQRGVPGNFYKSMETLKKVDEAFDNDPHIIKNVSTVITRYNVDQIYDFMLWIHSRFHATSHIIEAARGMTREDGVKVLTEPSLRRIQDEVAPIYNAYARRMADRETGLRRKLINFFYLSNFRAFYNIRASNIDKPTPWGMDCTAGETTLVIDYDGRFRSCELREPIGNVKDYGCDVQKIMRSEAMRKEIETIGHGHKANCWCTHGCWIQASLTFNPGKRIIKSIQANREMRRLDAPLNNSESVLRGMEEKYRLDRARLIDLGVIQSQGGEFA